MTNNLEWAKGKAEQLLRSQVDGISSCAYPDEKECRGMVEMAYACGLINTTAYEYWHNIITQAVADRRAVLRVERYYG